MKLLMVCDPPIVPNGYNTGASQVIINMASEFTELGHITKILTAKILKNKPASQSGYDCVCQALDQLDFDHVHLATEGRLGLLVRRYCVARGLRFTSAYHGQYPEFLQIRHGWNPRWAYTYLRWFHNRAERVIVPTPSMAARISDKGIKRAVSNSHGVNTDMFKPGDKSFLSHLPRPIWLYVGRLDPEKDLDAFLSLPLPGSKVVVGDGSVRQDLEQRYPDVHFAGMRLGPELVQYYQVADVFVFPSKTDTFGLVLLEALAAGIPVAAFPVTGPKDVITDPKVGCLDEDLRRACLNALNLKSDDCRQFALKHSWRESAERFLSFQVPCLPEGQFHPKQGLRLWFERKFNPLQSVLERAVTATENLLFGAKAHNLPVRRG